MYIVRKRVVVLIDGCLIREGSEFYEARYGKQAHPQHTRSVVEKDTMPVDIAVQIVPYFLLSSSRLVRLQSSPQSTTLLHSTHLEFFCFFVKKVA